MLKYNPALCGLGYKLRNAIVRISAIPIPPFSYRDGPIKGVRPIEKNRFRVLE